VSESDIEQAAAKRRAHLAAGKRDDDAKAVHLAAWRVKAERRTRTGLRDEALGDVKGGKALSMTVMLVCLFGSVALIIWLVPHEGVLELVVPFAGAMVILPTMFFVPMVFERRLAAARLGQLRRIGRGFDIEHYVDQLSQKRSEGRLVVRVQFERPFAATTKDAIPDAVLEWLPKVGRVAWDGDTLVLESAVLDATEWVAGGSVSRGSRYFTNVPFHARLLEIIGRVLPKLAATDPIAKLGVEITGKVLPWDAEAK
jgi:hypothetical protein